MFGLWCLSESKIGQAPTGCDTRHGINTGRDTLWTKIHTRDLNIYADRNNSNVTSC